jgi:membrane associated rhomboid family serine protease
VAVVPIKDDNPTTITPYVTIGLIVANILAFFYEVACPPELQEAFFHAFAVVPRELTGVLMGYGVDPATRYILNDPIPEWMTLFTSQFLHGGWLHLGGNMLFLWIFGNNVEDRLGHLKFLLFYLVCGALAALTQWFFSQGSGIPSLGASGAIAGVMGAYILRFPRVEILTIVPLGIVLLPLRIPAIFFLGFWFLQQAFYGVASLETTTNIGMKGGGIAYWAHAGGFVFGALLGPLLGLLDRRPGDLN